MRHLIGRSTPWADFDMLDARANKPFKGRAASCYIARNLWVRLMIIWRRLIHKREPRVEETGAWTGRKSLPEAVSGFTATKLLQFHAYDLDLNDRSMGEDRGYDLRMITRRRMVHTVWTDVCIRVYIGCFQSSKLDWTGSLCNLDNYRIYKFESWSVLAAIRLNIPWAVFFLMVWELLLLYHALNRSAMTFGSKAHGCCTCWYLCHATTPNATSLACFFDK